MKQDVIQISPRDNVLVLTRNVEAGSLIKTATGSCSVPVALTLGHKIAGRDIQRGEKIFKYGVPIGSATADIAAGEHVHVHNMKSDYIATYTFEKEHEFRQSQ